jgi:hypothetical protein
MRRNPPVPVNTPFLFVNVGVNGAPYATFGSSISPSGVSGGGFTSFNLQPGIYQIHLDGLYFTPTPSNSIPYSYPTLNGSALPEDLSQPWLTEPMAGIGAGSVEIVGGDRLIAVTPPNSQLAIVQFSAAVGTVAPGQCTLNIVQLATYPPPAASQ